MSWSEHCRRAAVLALLALQGACGFHFRGPAEVPPEMGLIHIQAADRYSPFYRELVTVLRRSDVRLTDDPVAAKTVIRIIIDDTGRRQLSVTARNVPAEYEVYYRLRFSVTMDGEEVVPVERLSLTREVSFDETQVLGKAGEGENIREALARDLVDLVTRRLAAVR